MPLTREPRDLGEEDRQRAMIPRRLWSVDHERVEGPHAEGFLKYLRHLPKTLDKGVGLLLNGEYGAGKSSCAVIVAKAVMAHEGSAQFAPAGKLAGWLIERTEHPTLSGQLIERARQVDLLIIDDLGEEPDKEFSTQCVVELVRARADDYKTTLITTNHEHAVLRDRYGDRLASVLNATMLPIHVAGKAWRRDRGHDVQEWFGGLK